MTETLLHDLDTSGSIVVNSGYEKSPDQLLSSNGHQHSALLGALAGKVDDDARRRVTEWLDESDAAQDRLGAGDGIGFFLSPWAIADAYKAIDDDEVREALELGPRQRVTRAQRIEFLELYRLPVLMDDADVTYLMVPVFLRSSNGEELAMVAGIQGYSFTMLTNTWWGPVESAVKFRAQLKRGRWVESVEEFGELSMKRKLQIVTGRVGGVVGASQDREP